MKKSKTREVALGSEPKKIHQYRFRIRSGVNGLKQYKDYFSDGRFYSPDRMATRNAVFTIGWKTYKKALLLLRKAKRTTEFQRSNAGSMRISASPRGSLVIGCMRLGPKQIKQLRKAFDSEYKEHTGDTLR